MVSLLTPNWRENCRVFSAGVSVERAWAAGGRRLQRCARRVPGLHSQWSHVLAHRLPPVAHS